jgi:hypothetical protein
VAFKSQAPLQSSGALCRAAKAKGGDHKKSSGSKPKLPCTSSSSLGTAANQSLAPIRPISRSPQHTSPLSSALPGCPSRPISSNGRQLPRICSPEASNPRIRSPLPTPTHDRSSPIKSSPNPSISFRRHNPSNSRHHQLAPLRNLAIEPLNSDGTTCSGVRLCADDCARRRRNRHSRFTCRRTEPN